MRKVLIKIVVILLVITAGLGFYLYLAPKLVAENRSIDSWIRANHLNAYGDAKNTAYSNKKPCRGAWDCYDYIKNMHPDKPWQK